MQLNWGKFSINGQTGYILKPAFLRNSKYTGNALKQN
jgi:hypothetical protein